MQDIKKYLKATEDLIHSLDEYKNIIKNIQILENVQRNHKQSTIVSNVENFINVNCSFDDTGEITSNDLYNKYVQYCNLQLIMPVTKNKFRKIIRQSFKENIKICLVTNKRLSGFKGIIISKKPMGRGEYNVNY